MVLCLPSCIKTRSPQGPFSLRQTVTACSCTCRCVRNCVNVWFHADRKSSSEARAACRVYQPFESLLQEANAALAPKTAAEAAGVSEKDLSGLASALGR